MISCSSPSSDLVRGIVVVEEDIDNDAEEEEEGGRGKKAIATETKRPFSCTPESNNAKVTELILAACSLNDPPPPCRGLLRLGIELSSLFRGAGLGSSVKVVEKGSEY